jgi:hypothetical protein
MVSMAHLFVDGLSSSGDSCRLSLRTRALSAFIRSPRLIGQVSLESGRAAWLFERQPVQMTESTWSLPRRIDVSGSDLWVSEVSEVMAELLPTEDGGVLVSARHAETGRQLWEYFIPIPDAAQWAEPSPAWPGAQTEEIDAFFANDPTRLIVCLSRQSRRRRIYSPAITVDTLPPHAYQTDAIRLDTSSGVPAWRASFQDIVVGIIERDSFTGIWSSRQRVGVLDFEAGTNRILHEYPHALGWPIQDGSLVAVPWHSNREVGVAWLDERGSQVRQGTWPQARASKTYLHHTEAGLAMQVDDQTLWWLGKQDVPLWHIRAKPYIYRVHCCPASDVFVGTDGRGGRLLAFDAASGEETLNLKPPVGGAGTLTKVPAHDVLVAKFWTSRRDSVAGSLLVLSMRDRCHRLDCQCRDLLGAWTHGAICVAGQNGERLAIVDIR